MHLKSKLDRARNALLALVGLFIFSSAAVPASAAMDCSALNQSPIFHLVNPTTKTNLLTANQAEAQNAKASFGFTDDRGTIFYAATQWASGLVPAYRMHHPTTNNFFWSINQNEIDSAVNNLGYQKNSVNFFVSSTPTECTQPVYRYRQGAFHRYAVTQADRNKLLADGWIYEGPSFYAGIGNQDNDTLFSIVILPDTQQEVQPTTPRNLNDLRFRQRMQWLADNKSALDLRYVLHSGDVVNWGERDTHQYNVATDAYQVLHTAGIPFILSVGNHDTRAVCEGGSACAGQNAHTALRELPLYNSYFEPLMGTYVAGRYQAGELANVYSLFEAGGVKWLVLSIELWPRAQVVEWAKGIVAAHPNHNVIVVTHSFLTKANAIYTSNGGYGDQSPQYLYENLIRRYSNIRLVFSGHEGNASSRTFTGDNGNKIVASLQAFHSGLTNPVRIMEIDTANNKVKTRIFAPHTGENWTQYNYEETGMNFIR